MPDKATPESTRHIMTILREAMRDPALSGGCFLLGELFAAIAEQDEARVLLDEIPAWKVPGLLLSAALLYRAVINPAHPLARYLADPTLPLDVAFRAAVCRALTEEKDELLALFPLHTYQCNPPRRMAVSLLVAATATRDWAPALHLDIGTASGIGLMLGDVAVLSGRDRLGPAGASLELPITLRGAPLDLASLHAPQIDVPSASISILPISATPNVSPGCAPANFPLPPNSPTSITRFNSSSPARLASNAVPLSISFLRSWRKCRPASPLLSRIPTSPFS